MKKTIALNSACFAILLILGGTPCSANDGIKEQILELFPQADTNNDGVISDAEEAALSRQALKRSPKADKDGDGVLSNVEKQAQFRAAANRVKRNPASLATDNTKKKPSFANVKYGEHNRQVFDIWLADTAKPAPLAVYIHGGGFRAGSKEKLNPNELSRLLKAGISVAAINYRYVTMAPLPAAHHDAAAGIAIHCVPRRTNGTSTKARSLPLGVQPVRRSACGWPTPTRWRTPIARIRSSGNQLG